MEEGEGLQKRRACARRGATSVKEEGGGERIWEKGNGAPVGLKDIRLLGLGEEKGEKISRQRTENRIRRKKGGRHSEGEEDPSDREKGVLSGPVQTEKGILLSIEKKEVSSGLKSKLLDLGRRESRGQEEQERRGRRKRKRRVRWSLSWEDEGGPTDDKRG